MVVRELIELLRTFPPDIPVCYEKFSEQVMLEPDELRVVTLQPARNDGWVHDQRPDKPAIEYLCFPGN